MRKATLFIALSFSVLLMAASACGGNGSKEYTPTARAAKHTPTAHTATPSPHAPTTTPAGAATAMSTPAQGGAKLTIIAKDTKFDSTAIQAKPGKLEIILDNEDTGVSHNIHVFMGASASGPSIGMTALKAGPTKETLIVDLAPGEYYYQCDAHPNQMEGTISVQ